MKRARLRALLVLALLACGEPPPAIDPTGPVAGWAHYGGDAGASRYSPLTQITRANVDRLEVAWVHHNRDVLPKREGKTAFQATPILDGDTLYFCSALNRVFAVQAETGEQLWVFDPQVRVASRWTHRCRGVSIWRDPLASPGASCARRVFTSTLDARLIALDAATGMPCPGFGTDGAVDLRRGLGPHEDGDYEPTSVPTVVGEIVAVGAAVIDARRLYPPSGVVRGFDVRSGALRWAFDPAPPGSAPPPPGPDGPRYRRGTPNAWGVFSADPERDLLFLPMGNPSPDFYLARACGKRSTTSAARWWRSTPRRESSRGASRRSTTISGITTSRRPRR